MLRQDMQTRLKSGFSRYFALLQRAVLGYGERFGRVIGWSIVIILGFAILYLFGGFVRPVAPDGSAGAPLSISQLPGDPSVLWESLYYSTLTFTALGFGDFRPIGAFGQMFTVIETSFGALLLALLVFVLGRRAAR
jgi:hypothetical protein